MKSRGEPGWPGAEEERKAGLNNSFAPSVSNAIAKSYTYGAKKTEQRSRWGASGERRVRASSPLLSNRRSERGPA